MTLLAEATPRMLYANIVMYECGHPVTPLVCIAASKTAGHQRRTWFPRASVRPMLQSPASKRSSRNPSPTTSRTRKTQKAMDSVCDGSLAQCRGDAVEAA